MKILNTLLLVLPLIAFGFKVSAQNQQAPQPVIYYFVELIPNMDYVNESTDETQTIQMGHMQNIGNMAQQGKLLLAGPFADGGGLFILNAKSKEEAESWVNEDPAVKAGKFKFKVRTWYTEKGMLSLEKEW